MNSAPPPSKADPELVGNADGDRNAAARDKAAIERKLEAERETRKAQ